jgi:putative endonuclease
MPSDQWHLTSFPSSPRKRGPRTGASSVVDKRPCVYILANRRNGTLYVGVTSDLTRRVWGHRSGAVDGFTRDYGVRRLVFVEFHETMEDAILREKRIKRWRRAWKLELIEQGNRQWRDLYDELAF